MKKSLTCALLAVIMVLLMGVTSYAVTGDIVLVPSTADIKSGDEFTVDIAIANLGTENGVIAFGATLDYDKSALTLVKMEGLNSWPTPINGISYNDENGIMALDRGGQGKNDETIVRITFKANKAGTTEVSLTNVNLADGIGTPLKIALVSKNITVAGDATVDPTPVPSTEPTAVPTTAPTAKATPAPTAKPTSSTQNGSNLPNTGEESMLFLGMGIVAVTVVAGICFIRYRKISKDM